MIYEVSTVESAYCVYLIQADSPEAAREKLMRGEDVDDWRDLGHDDMDIIEVREAE